MNKPLPLRVKASTMGQNILLFSLLLTLFASAEPVWKKELTSTAPGSHPAITPMSLDLQVSWKGMIDSGKVHIDFAPKGINKAGRLVVRSSSDSVGAASKLFPYHSDFWSEVDPKTLLPLYFHSNEVDRKEAIDSTVKYGAFGARSHEVTKVFKNKKTLVEDHHFAHYPTFDIFSAMLHVRSQALQKGDKLALIVMPFNTPYILRVKVLGREVHNGQKAIKLNVGMQKIDRDTLQLKPYKKLKRDATLWLSDDTDRIPLELRAAVFIGDVRATLVKKQRH